MSGSTWGRPSLVLFQFFHCKKARVSRHTELHKIVQTGTPAVHQCKRFTRTPSCTPPLTPTHPQHLTRISAALRHSPLSSFPFHQNIADEVLSSINHSAAPLHSPPPPPLISRSVVQRGQTCLCCRRMCLHPQNAFTYKRIQAGTSWSLIYFGIRRWAGLDFTLVIF